MPAAVRVFARERVSLSYRTVVPLTKVWVLTSVHIYNPLAITVTATLIADGFPIAGVQIPPGGTYVLDTKQVILAGASLGLDATAEGLIFSASGVQDGAAQKQINDVLVGTADSYSSGYATIDDIGSN